MWRKFYREARASKRGNGGSRGIKPYDRLIRAKSAIQKITGLEPDETEKQSQICRLIDELLASIQPAPESKCNREEINQ
ncbi:hypothetical protein [Mycobacterium timonense]|jgi:hypothetical protein|uniref:Uncharacterized protein n=1 Tax=Mycobacterium timonense TaxID=701043 RepID=A0A7I9Z363_9MYCO|nr:hypothetical protein [Mycobacterium timonense]GFG95316.1 hypothetical protein MTIM_11950 [Mycobacterium timonense]